MDKELKEELKEGFKKPLLFIGISIGIILVINLIIWVYHQFYPVTYTPEQIDSIQQAALQFL